MPAPNVPLGIDHFRQEAGLTKSGLAKAVGVTPGAVTAWLNGQSDVPTTRLWEICEACGTTLVVFFTWLAAHRPRRKRAC